MANAIKNILFLGSVLFSLGFIMLDDSPSVTAEEAPAAHKNVTGADPATLKK